MNAVELRQLSVQFDQKLLFEHLNFALPQGKWTSILGSSGVGKSTLLRVIAGLETRGVSGDIQFAPNTQLSYMAQQDALYPWLSVLDNVQLSQHLQGKKSAATAQKAKQLLSAVNMADHWHKPCYQLSGGQRQRVALARTLMQEANLVLMDEPFSALDAITRIQLQALACELLQNKTVLLITHDPQEAIRLSDAIYVLKNQPARLSQEIKPVGLPPRQLGQQALWQLQEQLLAELTEGV
ncbi:ATP-binding cassette domain-containing protein [[Haemophilus] felis]|uniref:Phosphonate ABC transporter ATP-binding protein n=1 Tax=[Haemophilus] felis TaxID=123822 RepID=A0A1T0AXC3_9PAST|nr:ATP-binding cassette domain-containing protein [[Haemophilus] felis]NBI40983.1 ATP-binding cassette domain-containing protein [[Haemophilus] felis]NBI42873.1 ATP-binding cassette domain-containing protein [[Haemophilus] felis]OOS02452.1 phosphonate ABC transporter ATP-binding protein [[Haemophilus] felis]